MYSYKQVVNNAKGKFMMFKPRFQSYLSKNRVRECHQAAVASSLIALFFAVACGVSSNHPISQSATDGFWNPGTATTTKVNFVLHKASAAKIPYEVVKITKNINWMGASVVQTDYEFNFKQITKAQCEQLKELYSIKGEGNYQFTSEVACAETGSYTLSQFLPPIVQATKGLAFKDEEKSGQVVATNCWGTAWEFARLGTDGVNAFFTDEKTIQAAYAKQKTKKLFHAQFKSSTTGPQLFATAAGKQLQTGDIGLIQADGTTPLKNSLQHAVIIIDENLVFQKWAGPEVFTYQLNTYDYVLSMYRDNMVHNFIRPQQKFASPKDVLGSNCMTTSTGVKLCQQVVFVPYSKDSQGRYTIKQGSVLVQ